MTHGELVFDSMRWASSHALPRRLMLYDAPLLLQRLVFRSSLACRLYCCGPVLSTATHWAYQICASRSARFVLGKILCVLESRCVSHVGQVPWAVRGEAMDRISHPGEPYAPTWK